MAISLFRRAFICWHFFQLTFRARGKEVLPNKTAFDTLSSEELHYLSSIHNWDDGATILKWIIESPKCDLGTAIMIFWLADPDWYFKYQSIPEDEFDADVWTLLQSILEKVRTEGFKTTEQRFVPDLEGYRFDPLTAMGVCSLPAVLLNGLP